MEFSKSCGYTDYPFELDPKHKGCLQRTEQIAKFEARPRCGKGQANPELAFRIGSETAEPIWTGHDVDEIDSKEYEVKLEGDKGFMQTSFTVRLNRAASFRFADATGANVGKEGFVTIGKEKIMAPTIKQRIDGGSLLIEGGKESRLGDVTSAMKKLCPKLAK